MCYELKTVKVECMTEGCTNLVVAHIDPRDKPPRKMCHSCKAAPAGDRYYGLSWGKETD